MGSGRHCNKQALAPLYDPDAIDLYGIIYEHIYKCFCFATLDLDRPAADFILVFIHAFISFHRLFLLVRSVDLSLALLNNNLPRSKVNIVPIKL